jgi:hypothetical protein
MTAPRQQQGNDRAVGCFTDALDALHLRLRWRRDFIAQVFFLSG